MPHIYQVNTIIFALNRPPPLSEWSLRPLFKREFDTIVESLKKIFGGQESSRNRGKNGRGALSVKVSPASSTSLDWPIVCPNRVDERCAHDSLLRTEYKTDVPKRNQLTRATNELDEKKLKTALGIW